MKTKFELFRFAPIIKNWKERSVTYLEILAKSAIMLIFPLLVTIGVVFLWYHQIYLKHRNMSEGARDIVIAWTSIIGLFYGLFVSALFSTVWSKYIAMRMAVRTYNVDEYVNLRDEEMSPLAYIVMSVLSILLTGSIMVFNYPDLNSGIMVISGVVYVTVLIFFTIVEIDQPCSGLWFIKNIPADWPHIDRKAWRAEKHASEREKIKMALEKHAKK